PGRRRRRRAWAGWAIPAVALASATAGAQDAPPPVNSGYTLFHPTPAALMRPLSADRPDKTDAPFTVDAGHLQWEMDFANATIDRSQSPAGWVRSDATAFVPLAVRIGLLNDLEFQVTVAPYQRVDVRNEATGEVSRKSGFGDVTSRVKLNLIGNDGGTWAVALAPFVKIPTAADGLGNGAWEGGLGIPVAVAVPGWDVGFESAFDRARNDRDGGYHLEIANSISIGYPVGRGVEPHVEFYGSVGPRSHTGWVGTVDSWITVAIASNTVFDGGVFIGTTPAADDWHPWVGVTRRF
ncbi:MAG: transporter, partial [Gemmatimonadaceae bacterium]